ncbi:MAG: hypothetical protein Q4G60_10240 [bacterium]|nr:hypothetical protein [bacterium]
MDTNTNVTQASSVETTITIGEWILTTFLMMIPCVGIIMTFVWAFGDTKRTKPSKSNYAKAMLIWYAVSAILSAICWSAMASAIATLVNSIQ